MRFTSLWRRTRPEPFRHRNSGAGDDQNRHEHGDLMWFGLVFYKIWYKYGDIPIYHGLYLWLFWSPYDHIFCIVNTHIYYNAPIIWWSKSPPKSPWVDDDGPWWGTETAGDMEELVRSSAKAMFLGMIWLEVEAVQWGCEKVVTFWFKWQGLGDLLWDLQHFSGYWWILNDVDNHCG